MHAASLSVIGASGYTGVELTRLLAHHPHASVRHLVSDRWQGERVEDRVGPAGPLGEISYSPMAEAFERAAETDVALLATPVEVSLELAPKLHARGVRVIDLSGAFRIYAESEFYAAYGLSHPAPALLPEARYGLTELARAELAGAGLVANPGCYPTATLLGLCPLLEAGLLSPEPLVVNAASGTTGAGRKGSEDLSFSEVADDFRAYKVLKHQHTPEIAQLLARAAGRPAALTFTAHLLPVRRGILVTSYARAAQGVALHDLQQALRARYQGSAFVRVRARPEDVGLKGVVGTNFCDVSVALQTSGADAGRVLVFSAIDNLVKGAAGQAVQNLNVMMGWPEIAGLLPARRAAA